MQSETMKTNYKKIVIPQLLVLPPKNQIKKARKLLKLTGLKTVLKGGLEPPRQ